LEEGERGKIGERVWQRVYLVIGEAQGLKVWKHFADVFRDGGELAMIQVQVKEVR